MLLNQYRNHSKSTRLLYNKVGLVKIPPYPFTPKRINGEGLYKVDDYLVIALASWCLQILTSLNCIYLYIIESSPYRARIFVELKTRGGEIV